MERAWGEIEGLTDSRVVLDGIRTLAESAWLSERAPFLLVAFQRPAHLRYERLLRGSALYSRMPNSIIELECHELQLGVGDLLAVADYVHFSSASEAALPSEAHRAADAIVDHLARAIELGWLEQRIDNRTRYSALQTFLPAKR